MRYGKPVLFLAAAMFAAACTGRPPVNGGDEEVPASETDDDHADGSASGPSSCENDGECPQDQVCEDHLCGPSDVETGDPPDGGGPSCTRDDDCPEDQVCEDHLCGLKCPGDDHDDDDDDNDDGDDADDDDDAGGQANGLCAEGPTACEAGKTLVCHVPPGHPSNRHGICIGGSSASAHLGHGDIAGCCPQ